MIWAKFNLPATFSPINKVRWFDPLDRFRSIVEVSVRSLINQSYLVPSTPETEQDLRSIAEALYENLKDKNVTITHQRKTNKCVIFHRLTQIENSNVRLES